MQKAYTHYYIKYAHMYHYPTAQAILWHDLGKVYCKTFTNAHGIPTDEAHFYGHENVSAYLFLTLLAVANVNGTLRSCDKATINLIQHHMDFFKPESYLQKIAKRYGEDFMRQLAIIHACDIAAH